MMMFRINSKAESMNKLFITRLPLDKRTEALRSSEHLE